MPGEARQRMGWGCRYVVSGNRKGSGDEPIETLENALAHVKQLNRALASRRHGHLIPHMVF